MKYFPVLNDYEDTLIYKISCKDEAMITVKSYSLNLILEKKDISIIV